MYNKQTEKPDRKVVLGEVESLDTDSKVLPGFILVQLVVDHPQGVTCNITRLEHLFWEIGIILKWSLIVLTNDTASGFLFWWLLYIGQWKMKGFGCSLEKI